MNSAYSAYLSQKRKKNAKKTTRTDGDNRRKPAKNDVKKSTRQTRGLSVPTDGFVVDNAEKEFHRTRQSATRPLLLLFNLTNQFLGAYCRHTLTNTAVLHDTASKSLPDLRGIGQLQLHQRVAAPDSRAGGDDGDRIHHRKAVELAHAARLRPLRRAGHVKLHRHLKRGKTKKHTFSNVVSPLVGLSPNGG